jgi:hypothetical protein
MVERTCASEVSLQVANRMKRALLMVGAGIVLLVVVGVAAAFVIGQGTPTDDPVQREVQTFPDVTGTSLLLEQVKVPGELSGDYKLIVVSYEVEQQGDVNEWLPALEALKQEFPRLAGYYVPLLPKDAADSSTFIIGGMSLAAGNDTDRARTIVVFTNVDAFNGLVGVEDKATIQLFLLGGDNEILWHGSGAYSDSTLAALRAALVKNRA